MRYDKLDTVTDTLDDVTSVAMLRELIDWCGTNALMRRLADASQVRAARGSSGRLGLQRTAACTSGSRGLHTPGSTARSGL